MSVYPDDGLDAETLIKNADTAMYQAKENGRQSYQFFKPAMNVRAVERQSIEESLRRALERQEFDAALPAEDQSEDGSDYRGGSVDTLDASDAGTGLSGAVHSRRGRLRPHSADRRTGSCAKRAGKPEPGWTAGLPAMTMAVNVSAMEFRNENFLEGLFAILDETGLDPRSLELELTESVLMKRAESAASILQTV